MDKDVTGLAPFLSSWIPQKVNEKLVPVVEKAEKTSADINGIIRNTIRNGVSSIIARNMSIDNQVMDKIDNRITPIEGRIDSLNKKIMDKIETQMFPKELMASMQQSSIKSSPLESAPPPSGGLPAYICLVHTIPEAERHTYDTIYEINNNDAVVGHYSPPPYPTGYSLIHRFPQWYQAELYCRMFKECGYSLIQLHELTPDLEQVLLDSGQTGFIRKPLCEGVNHVWPKSV